MRTFMEVPFHKPYITEDEIAEVLDSLRSGWLTMGPKTVRFEEKFRDYIGAEDAVSMNSCTAGLHLALIAAGIKEGDEVILPAVTFTATAEVVTYLRARFWSTSTGRPSISMRLRWKERSQKERRR